MKTINILFLGNSFSDDTVMYLPELFREYKIKANVENVVYGGCSLGQHLDFLQNEKPVYTHRYVDKKRVAWDQDKNDVNGADIIRSKKWDYISLQQASFLAGNEDSFANINDLVELVRKYCPNKNVKFIWNMTWEYPNTNKFDVFRDEFSFKGEEMYKGITKVVKKFIVGNDNFSMIIPNGTAIRNLKNIYTDQDLYRDNLHLSYHLGRYVTSLTAFKKIFGIDISNTLTRPFSLLKADRKYCAEAVNNAVESPFKPIMVKKVDK